MDFNRKIKKIKTHKISYTGPLYITDAEYGCHSYEMQSFCQFLPQNGDFR
jgi:hypothetical protein